LSLLYKKLALHSRVYGAWLHLAPTSLGPLVPNFLRKLPTHLQRRIDSARARGSSGAR